MSLSKSLLAGLVFKIGAIIVKKINRILSELDEEEAYWGFRWLFLSKEELEMELYEGFRQLFSKEVVIHGSTS